MRGGKVDQSLDKELGGLIVVAGGEALFDIVFMDTLQRLGELSASKFGSPLMLLIEISREVILLSRKMLATKHGHGVVVVDDDGSNL